MSSELSKTYEPAAVEAKAYATWIEKKAFAADPKAKGEPFSIVIPPLNVTGALHLGHAINNTLQDILTRKARMEGKNSVWIPGVDHAGIATQAVVEKQLKELENKTRHDVGREELVKRIWAWKEQYGDRIVEQLKRLGCSCDWDRLRFTLDEQCARAVRETFFKLFKDGLVFRGKRLVNWDVHLQTSISDDEIYHENVKTFLWYIKYPIEGTEGRPDHVVVATTRPETMLGDTAVAVNSEDRRWSWAIGLKVTLPLTGRLIPIIADNELVDPKFGTGCVKVTPAHDPNDYAVWQRHQGKTDEIDLINILNPDGTLNENAGAYAGMRRDKARTKVVDDLKGHGLLVKEEPYETQVGHSDRSKTAIEPYLSDQWFVRMAPLAEPALEVVRQGMVKFHPERHAQQYLSWLGEKRDWPISRQLWWGHRIPVWSKTLDENARNGFKALQISPKGSHWKGIDLKAFAPVTGALSTVVHMQREHPEAIAVSAETAALSKDKNAEIPAQLLVCVRQPEAHTESKLTELGFVQDPDVLDTWFSSALWPHSTLGWPEKTAELAKWNPTSVLVTARDIITLWVARMVMMNLYNMGENRFTSKTDISDVKLEIQRFVPFFDVAINPTILDGKGERMSKSKGNGVDPVDIIDTHGADALRFTMTQMATETQDVRLPVKKLPDGRNTSDKFDVGRNFCNKLWNASRFALSNLESINNQQSTADQLSLADKWILSRLARTVAEANDAIANYRFDQYARACYQFFWNDFCDWYVEIVKPIFKTPEKAGTTAAVLAAALDQSLRLMHPMIPFITETIWWRLNEVRPSRSIANLVDAPLSPLLIHASWPKDGTKLIDEQVEREFALMQETIVAIRNVRNEHKVDVKKVVTVSISPADAATQAVLQSNVATIQLLATCTINTIASGLSAPAGAVRTVIGTNEIFIEGMIDADAEKGRLSKRKEELTKQIAAMKGRLGNEGYIAKAPPHLVEQTTKQLAEAEAELAKL